MKDQAVQTVGVVVFQGNEVLLVKHTNKAKHLTNTYGLPAGRIKKGESMLEAAIRELEEETGFKTIPEHMQKMSKK